MGGGVWVGGRWGLGLVVILVVILVILMVVVVVVVTVVVVVVVVVVVGMAVPSVSPHSTDPHAAWARCRPIYCTFQFLRRDCLWCTRPGYSEARGCSHAS